MGNGASPEADKDTSRIFVAIVPPDILFVRPVGLLLPEDLLLTGEKQREIVQSVGYSLLLADCSRLTGLPVETRRAMPEYARKHANRAIAIFGASYQMTILATLVSRAVEGLLKLDRPTRCFHSEAEARAWLDERRRLIICAGCDAPSSPVGPSAALVDH